MINKTGSIELSYSSGRPRIARTKANISKAKWRLDHNKRVSTRRLAAEIKIPKMSAHRILLEDRGCFPYKKIKQLKLTNLQKQKSVKFANWVLNNCAKNDTKRWLFTDEKFFYLDGIYNTHNDRVWAVNREEADKKGGVHDKNKFPVKVRCG